MSLNLDGLILVCHFMADEVIKFDIDPHELTHARFYELLDFMQSLGRRLKREVLLTPEMKEHDPIVKYDPVHDRIVKVLEEHRKRY